LIIPVAELTAVVGPLAPIYIWLFLLDRKVNRLCGYVAGMRKQEAG